MGEVVKDNVSGEDTWSGIRWERDRKLAACDWTQIGDSPFLDDQLWLGYRQALRDITKDFPSPEDVVWPTVPTATK